MKARIKIVGAIPGKGTVIELDGTDYAPAISRLTIDSAAERITEVIITMPIVDGVDFDGEARVRLDSYQAELIEALGWTPPGGKD